MKIIYALALFAVLFLAWHFYIHALLRDMVFARVTRKPVLLSIMSLVSFIAALFIVWAISGISVLHYLAALLAAPQIAP